MSAAIWEALQMVLPHAAEGRPGAALAGARRDGGQAWAGGAASLLVSAGPEL